MGCCTHAVDATCDLDTDAVPIGRPIPGTAAFVLDDGLCVPSGVAAELHVGGACLARGYLGDPARTAERFRPDPYGGGRLYRTGDRVRVGRDGALRFLGRSTANSRSAASGWSPPRLKACWAVIRR